MSNHLPTTKLRACSKVFPRWCFSLAIIHANPSNAPETRSDPTAASAALINVLRNKSKGKAPMAAAYDSIPNLETLYCKFVPLVFVKGSVMVGMTRLDVTGTDDARVGGGRVGGGCLAEVDFERETERVLDGVGPVSSVVLVLIVDVGEVGGSVDKVGDGGEVGVASDAVISCRRWNCLPVNDDPCLVFS